MHESLSLILVVFIGSYEVLYWKSHFVYILVSIGVGGKQYNGQGCGLFWLFVSFCLFGIIVFILLVRLVGIMKMIVFVYLYRHAGHH